MTLRAALWLGASALALTSGILLTATPAHADCVLTGGTVNCGGTDDDGFSGGNSLTVNVQTGAFVQSVYDGNPSTFCPAFRSALRLGTGARVTNAGVLLGRGNCGLGIDAQTGLVLTNTGTIQTDAEVAFAVLATNAFDVTNSGLIQTVNAGSAAFVGGNTGRLTNTATGRIETTSADSPGLFVEDSNAITNQGTIRTGGSGSFGIDAGNNNTITNSGTITATGVAASGIRARANGNSITNTGTITTLASVTPRDGEFSVGIEADGSANTITNTGTVAGDYAGVWLVSGGNTLTNGGTITARAQSTASTPGGAVLLSAGSNTVTNTGTIRGTGAAAIRTQTGATLQLTNTGRIEGDIIIAAGGAGSIQLGTGSIITGSISTAAPTTLILTGSGTLSNTIGPLARLNAAADSAWTLTRRYDSTSALISGGTLTLNDGLRVNDALTINGGRLQAIGTISRIDNSLAAAPTLQVTRGTVAPGLSSQAGATLTMDGNARVEENAVLAFDVSATAADRLNVSGVVRSGARIDITYGGAPVRSGQTFTVLSASNLLNLASQRVCAGTLQDSASLVAGCFTLSDNSPVFLRTTATVTNTDVVIRVDRTPFASVGQTPEEIGIAAAIDRAIATGSDPLNLVARLDTLTAADARSVFATLTTDAPVAAQTWSMLAAQTNAESLSTWLHLNAPGRVAGTWQTWGQVLARSGERGPKTNAANFDYEMKGVQAGADYAVSDTTRVGFTASHIDGDTFFAVGNAKSDLDLTSLGVYAGYTDGAWIANAGGFLSDGKVNATRLNGYVDPLALVVGNLAASADIDAGSAFGEIGYDIPNGAWLLQPTLRLTFAHIKVGALDERVGTGLSVQAAKSTSVRGDVGLRAVHNTGPVRISGAAFWSHDLKDTARQATARLIGLPGSDFPIIGSTEKRGWLKTQAGASFDFTPSLTGTLAWTGILNDRLGGHSATAGLSYRW